MKTCPVCRCSDCNFFFQLSGLKFSDGERAHFLEQFHPAVVLTAKQKRDAKKKARKYAIAHENDVERRARIAEEKTEKSKRLAAIPKSIVVCPVCLKPQCKLFTRLRYLTMSAQDQCMQLRFFHLYVKATTDHHPMTCNRGRTIMKLPDWWIPIEVKIEAPPDHRADTAPQSAG